ncbi:MAG: alpha/beta hydrolase [Gammaproteobacteria bacterium]|nr:alpha/beta hydrolase [Gammaproteobacteria bacterium]
MGPLPWRRRLRPLLAALGAAVLAAGCALGPALPDGAQTLEDIPFIERDDLRLTGDLYLPAGQGPHPAVLLIHGGGWRNGDPGQMAHLGRRLAAAGFVAYSASYRFAPEYRHPTQLEDVRQALNWLAEHDRVDPDRVAVWGYSAGAHLALLLGFGADAGRAEAGHAEAGRAEAGRSDGEPKRPVAVVAGGSPTDFERFDPNGRLLVNLVGAPRDEDPEGWRRASPIHWADAKSPPVYLYHGRLDRVVDVGHSLALQARLEELGTSVHFDEVDWGHFWVFLGNRSVEQRATAFLQRTTERTLRHNGSER